LDCSPSKITGLDFCIVLIFPYESISYARLYCFYDSIHFVFFMLFVNQTIAFALFWAAVVRSSKAAQIGSTLWVLAMTVIAYTAWDIGNFFNTDAISNGLKTFITLWPIWGFYRGWEEYREFAAKV
jgi:hypothetical protein